MKIKPDRYDELELVVPKTIEDTYRADIKKHPEEWEDFFDWWSEKGEELFEPKNKNIFINKEIAEFFIDILYHSKIDYDEINTSEWLKFEDNGYRYSICAYGTTCNLDQFIGYKEKIIKKVVIKNESSN
ncbi:hypothetical protein ES695_08840 [Candidatus Atribacteria bacterium 1244-E10-H5-B2]|nr:MAG: hypothetical protein ES695_08840 [Candidatus Atribacteria bacterium 1244-E10-H5-B2]